MLRFADIWRGGNHLNSPRSVKLRAVLLGVTGGLIALALVAGGQIVAAQVALETVEVTAVNPVVEPEPVAEPAVEAEPVAGRASAVLDKAGAIAEAAAAWTAAVAAAEAEVAAAAEAEAQAAGAVAAAAAPPAPTAPPEPPDPGPVTDDDFDRLAQCESGANPKAYNPAGYYGAFQFSLATWHSPPVSMPGDPRDFSYAKQKAGAKRLQAVAGWSPWPYCASVLGLS